MSGFPNMEDIALLRDAIATVNKERSTIATAEAQRLAAERRIEEATERLRKAAAQVEELMKAMDCASPGNFGYGNRMMALLTGLAQVAEQYGRTHL